MFIPKNHLEVLTIVFEGTGLMRGTTRNDRLGFKEHSSLERHQAAYGYTIKIIIENLAQSCPDRLFNYVASFQRLLNEFHAPPYETVLEQSEGDEVYWKYFYAPMIALLLHKYSSKEYEGNAIHFLGEFLKSKHSGSEGFNAWPSDLSEKVRWAKHMIKMQLKLSSPQFTEKINDLRGTSIRSITSIKNDIHLLEEDLSRIEQGKEHDSIDANKHVAKVQSAYIAAMIIRRLEDSVHLKHCKIIAKYLTDIEANGGPFGLLLKTHEKICDLLLLGDYSYNRWQTEEGGLLIRLLDEIMIEHIRPTHPRIQEDLLKNNGSDIWPRFEGFDCKLLKHAELINATLCFGVEPSLLDMALFYYYKMYRCTEYGDFNNADFYCKKAEEYIGNVHLGQYLPAILMHKIILHWLIHGSMKHNQFSAEITSIVLYIEDEHRVLLHFNPVFINYIDGLSDEGKMMINVFRVFNQRHDKVVANPLKPIIDAIKVAIEICESNRGAQDLLSIFHKELDPKYKRTHSILPFIRLTLPQSINMIPELFEFFGLSLDMSLYYKFKSNPKCEKLINEHDSKFMIKK